MGVIDAVVKPKELLATACAAGLAIASGKKPRRMSLYLTDKVSI